MRICLEFSCGTESSRSLEFLLRVLLFAQRDALRSLRCRGHRYSQHRTLGVFTTRFLCPFLDRQFSILLTVCLLIPIVSPISAGLFPCRSASITNRSRGDRMFITSAITAVVSRSRTCFRTSWRESVALKLCSVEVGSLSSEDHLGGSSRLFGNAIPGLMQADAR